MGICRSACLDYQDTNSSKLTKKAPDYSAYKTTPQPQTAQAAPKPSRKNMNYINDSNKSLLQSFYRLHKSEIDPEILLIYLEVLNGEPRNVQEVSFKFRTINAKQAKFLSVILPYCPDLYKLNLWRTNLGDSGIKYITKCLPNLLRLQQLSIEENNITEVGFSYLAKGLRHLKNLKILSIHQNILGITGAQNIAVALQTLERLEELYLDSTKIDTEQLSILAGGISELWNLKKLGLAFNQIDGRSTSTIKEIVDRLKSLKEVFISGNQLNEDEAEAMVNLSQRVNIRA